jgi:hypothetical protein
VDLSDGGSRTALHYAIFKGFLPLAAALLKAGADPNRTEGLGYPPLLFAVRGGDLRATKLLLDYGANPNAIIRYVGAVYMPPHDRSLLTIAVFNGFADIARLLLKEGADPHPAGMPPLLAALNMDYREVLAALLDGRTEDVLLEFDGESFLVHAIARQSSLLSIIARLVEAETAKAGDAATAPFPPKSLTRRQRKDLKRAMNMHDDVLSVEAVNRAVRGVKRPWKKSGSLHVEVQGAGLSSSRLEAVAPLPAPPEPEIEPAAPAGEMEKSESAGSAGKVLRRGEEEKPESAGSAGKVPRRGEGEEAPGRAVSRAGTEEEEEEEEAELESSGKPPEPPRKQVVAARSRPSVLSDSEGEDSNPF